MSLIGEDDERDVIEDDYDDSAHQGCYILKTAAAEQEEIDSRPKKKRKLSKSKYTEKEHAPFPRLLGGQESESSANLRRETFEQLWAVQQAKIDNIIAESNNSFIEDIARFVRHASSDGSEHKLPTGLVVVGRDSGAQQRLLKQWQSDDRTKPSEFLIELDHNQAANIISALKSVIRSVITSSIGQDGYVDFLAKHKRLIPVNHDLELLQQFGTEHMIDKVVVSVLDIESFDISVLSDLITMLSSWTDRIPFVLLIGISTTIELFEARLPKSATVFLSPRVFDISQHANNPVYEIFIATQRGPDTRLWLGPAAAAVLLEKSNEQETTPERFGQMIKYVYMSHFFANALSLLLVADKGVDHDTKRLVCEAVRNTPSFACLVESLLPVKTQARQASKLLEDDDFLFEGIRDSISESKVLMENHYKSIDLLHRVILAVRYPAIDFGQSHTARPDILADIFTAAVNALKGPAATESILEDLGFYDIVEQLPLDTFRKVYHLTESLGLDSGLSARIDKLHKKSKDLPVHLTGDKSQWTPLHKEYHEIQSAFVKSIDDELRSNMVEPTTLFFHEAFIYNSKTPLSQVFTPSPRYSIERALDRPVDYLGCECCASENNALQPPTAILWRLWCEAGGVVNARDLWEAFRSSLLPAVDDDDNINGVDAEGEEAGMNERRALALFYRSLAELKMLGMARQSKRKPGVECLAKIAWRGM